MLREECLELSARMETLQIGATADQLAFDVDLREQMSTPIRLEEELQAKLA